MEAGTEQNNCTIQQKAESEQMGGNFQNTFLFNVQENFLRDRSLNCLSQE